jgi:serine/threonine kinase 4
LQLQGSYRSKGSLWIVMEHCGGGSVNDLLSASSQPLEEDMIAHICCESLKVGSWPGSTPAASIC